MVKLAEELGTAAISKLLMKQAVPAAIGILVMSLNMIIDTIFVGQWIGVLAIAAITVVLPIAFMISSIGMGIGIGGSSIISRALGDGDLKKAILTFGNQMSLTILLVLFFVVLGNIYSTEILTLFGGKGRILQPSQEYFDVIIYGVPFLTFAMMGNPVIRAVGKPKFAMYAMMIPAAVNIFLDILFIKYLNMGMYGAGLATSISFASCGLFILYFFISNKSELKIVPKYFRFEFSIVNEIVKLGGISVVRQGTISVLMIVLNYSLYKYGGEISISIFGIINRVMMFALFPLWALHKVFYLLQAITMVPKNSIELIETIQKAIIYGCAIAGFIYVMIIIFSEEIIRIFSTDPILLAETPRAMILVFLVSPIIAIQLVGSAYFQAAGKALPALFLTLLKQGVFLIPLAYILPIYYGVDGVWYSFAIGDVLATIITYIVLKKEIKTNLKERLPV